MNGYKELYNAVKEHEPSLTTDDFTMISENGADWGVTGFTYYKDTLKFYDDNRVLIEDFLMTEAEEHGLKNMFELPKLGRLTVETITDFKNFAAWYILETVAHQYSDWGRPVHGGIGGAPEYI
jgi:hypothetical protein